MNEEMLALKKTLEDINALVGKGLMSKETADEKFAEIARKLETIDARVKETEESMRKRSTAMDGLQDEKQKFSILQAIRGVTLGAWDKANSYEKSVMAEYRAAMDATNGGNGGYLVPAQAIMDIIELLRAEAVVMRAGASVMTDLIGSPVEIPKQTGGATAFWVGENSAITESALTLGQLTMTPKQVAALVKLSNRLIKLSNPGAEALVRADIASALALAIDLAALRGSGESSVPMGIANTPHILTYAIGAAGGAPTFDIMAELEGKLEDANALRGNLAYIMSPKVKRLLKKQKVAQFSGDTGGMPLILPMTDQQLSDRLGYGFYGSTQIPTNLEKGGAVNLSEIYFANWRELLIGQWGGLEIATSNVAGDNNGGAFSSNQTWIRAIQEVDIAVRHPESFCLCSDARTA
jgi:HK97 family phage major capsid protein